MEEEKILKRAAIYSLILMICIVTFSTNMRSPKESFSYAGEISQIPVPPNDNRPVSTEKLPVEVINTENKNKVESPLPVSLNSKIEEKYGDNIIAISKPNNLLQKYTFSLEDLAVDRQIVVTITGLKSESIKSNDIFRIYQGNYNYGPIETITPTPIVSTEIDDSINTINCDEPISSDDKNNDLGTITPTPEPTPTPIPKDSVTGFNITYTSTSDKSLSAVITIDLIKTYGYLLKEDENYFYICLVNPHELYDTIVVLDAGHGGDDSGTYSSGYEYLEKTMNLDMILKLQEYFNDNENIKIYMTRTTDRRLTLNQRVNLANDVEADLFLSIHCNANLSKAIHGTEVLFNDKQNDWNSFNSKQFAQICLEELVKVIDLKDRGIVPRSKDVHIIGEAKVPVALVEVAFMSNKDDMNFLKQDRNRQKAAEGIYNGILRSLEIEKAEVK